MVPIFGYLSERQARSGYLRSKFTWRLHRQSCFHDFSSEFAGRYRCCYRKSATPSYKRPRSRTSSNPSLATSIKRLLSKVLSDPPSARSKRPPTVTQILDKSDPVFQTLSPRAVKSGDLRLWASRSQVHLHRLIQTASE